MLKNYQIREKAAHRMRGNWGKGALVTLIVIGINLGILFLLKVLFGVDMFVNPYFSDEPIYTISKWVAMLFVVAPITVGTYWAFLSLSRGKRINIGNMFDTFNGNYLRIVLTSLLFAVYTLLWMLLFIVPGIYKLFSYSLTPFILKDNPTLTANEAITKSRRMMDGHKGKLFVLFLTFFGWFCLSILTLGIGFLWLVPYIQTSMATFYDEVKKQQQFEQYQQQQYKLYRQQQFQNQQYTEQFFKSALEQSDEKDDVVYELRKYAEQYNNGEITQEEFEAIKASLLQQF